MGKIDELLDVMARLRDPAQGCPWDREQSFATIAPYTLEEAYEVADAIERGDLQELKGELGDLLFQVVFYAQMAREQGLYGFEEIVQGIVEKLVRRHPHVFGDMKIDSAQAQTQAWEAHKATERARGLAHGRPAGALDGVAVALPALTRAVKLQKRAAHVGFDWPDVAGVLDKIEEEIGELRAELGAADHERLLDEIGDLFFACANLARRLQIDPETSVRRANAKFERRFRLMEALLAERGRSPTEASLTELDELWDQVKAQEPGAST